MQKIISLFLVLSFFSFSSQGQCSLCTKTASQLGEKPAKSLNKGIIYLAIAPLSIGAALWFLHKKYGAGLTDNQYKADQENPKED
jgi:hypothetical protein